MQRVTVKHSKKRNLRAPKFLFDPLLILWPFASLVLPVLLIYGLDTYGIPMIWIAENRDWCSYVSPLTEMSFMRMHEGEKCNWYAFQKISIYPLNKITQGGW